MGGVEPPTTGLWVLCSTAELHWHERNSRDFPKKATLLRDKSDNEWVSIIFTNQMSEKSHYHKNDTCYHDYR